MSDELCRYCHGSGWITCVDYDDTGYEVPCPNCTGAAPLEPDETDTEAAIIPEVPF